MSSRDNMSEPVTGSSTVYSDSPEVAVSTAPEHVASPDYDGEKVVIPKEIDPATLPQPAYTAINTDPASAPEAVYPEKTWCNQDPKSFPQALGLGGVGSDDSGYDPHSSVSPDSSKGAGAAAGFGSAGAIGTAGAAGAAGSAAAGAGAAAEKPWWKRKKMLALIAVMALVILGLVIGLAVGLSTNDGDGDDNDNNGGNTNQGSPGGGTSGGSDPITCDGGLCQHILAASVQDSVLNILARTSDGSIAIRTHNGDSWDSGWTDLGNGGGDIVSQPSSISWDVDGSDTARLDVFVVSGSSGTVLGKHRIDADGTWSDWEELGQGAGSQVKVCRPFDDRIDLWVLDGSSHNITHNHWVPNPNNEARRRLRKRQGEPDEEEPDEEEPDENEGGGSGGSGGGSSSSSYGSWQSNGTSSWDAMDPPKGPSSSAPGIVCRDSSTQHDLVWYDGDSGNLMHTQYNRDNGGSWSDPHTVEGDFVGDPLVFSSQDDNQRFDFFGVQGDGEMYTFTWRSGDGGGGTYSNLTSLGATAIVSSAAVISPSDDVLEVVALGDDGRLKHQHNDGDGWRNDWEDLEVEALSAPTVASFDGQVWVVSVTANGEMQVSSLDVNGGMANWRGELRTEAMGGALELSWLNPE